MRTLLLIALLTACGGESERRQPTCAELGCGDTLACTRQGKCTCEDGRVCYICPAPTRGVDAGICPEMIDASM